MVPISLTLVPIFDWAHECYKLSGDDPVEVAILDSFEVLVFLDIECSEVIPSESYGILQSLQTLQKCAVVETLTLGGISVMFEQAVVRLELFVGSLCGHLEDDDHEGSHKESSIYHFVSRSI